MEDFFLFDLFYLVPAAAAGVIAAIVLLILRRKKNGVRPKHATGMLIAAICLFVFAFVAVILIPAVYYIVLFIKFGTALFYAGLKSL